MKGKLVLLLIVTAMVFLLPASAFAAENQVVFTIGSSSYSVNGQVYDMPAAPFIENDRTFVPVRFLALSLGVLEKDIQWFPESQQVVLSKVDTFVGLNIGSQYMAVNDDISAVLMDVAPVIRDGYTYLPARYVAEAFGYQVGWDQDSQSVLVDLSGNPEDDTLYTITTGNYTEDNEKLGIDIKYPVFSDMDDQGIEAAVNDIIMGRVDGYKALYFPEEETYKQTITANFEISKETEGVISLYFTISRYVEGAAHPSNLVDGVIIDLQTGKELVLKDLFKEDVDYTQVLNPILDQKIAELDYELFEFNGLEEEQGFYLTDSGLVLYYQEDVYAPHVVGPLIFEISYDEIADYITGEY